MSKILAHLKRQSFAYFVLPISLAVTYGVIILTNRLTGRESTDDVGGVVGYFYAAIKCIVAIALTVLVKTHTDISRPSSIDGTPAITNNWELAISRGSTILLIWLFLWAIDPSGCSVAH